MIIRIKHWRGHNAEMDLHNAVDYVLTPEPYSYNGQLERLEGRLDLHKAFLARLTGILVEQGLLTDASLRTLLGSEFEIEL